MRWIFLAAGVVFSFLLLSVSAATYVPGPRVEQERAVTELVLAILALLSFWFASPWFPRRFSLRTLLIVTTVIAVGLGIIVWVSRAG